MARNDQQIATSILLDTTMKNLRDLISREEAGLNEAVPKLADCIRLLSRVKQRLAFHANEAAKKALTEKGT